jgi:hypothetical protein
MPDRSINMKYWLSISNQKTTHLVEILGQKYNLQRALKCVEIPEVNGQLLITRHEKPHETVVCSVSKKHIFQTAKPYATVERIKYLDQQFLSRPGQDPTGDISQWLLEQEEKNQQS